VLCRENTLVVLLLCSCSSGATVDITATGWRSAIIAIDTNGALALSAHDGPGPILIERDAQANLEVVVVLYAQPLASMFIPAGAIALDPDGRALPPTALPPLARTFRDGQTSELETIALDDPRLTRLRIAEISGAQCDAVDRCLQLDALERSCVSGCTAEGTVTPMPPEAPRLGPCTRGWTEVGGECRPPPQPARLSCPPGEGQHRGAIACAPIGHTCPAGEWPNAIPTATVVRFVHPRGDPGPGGEVSFTTVADALIGAPAGAVIVLSRGEHGGDFTLTGQALVGACAAQTILGQLFRAIEVVGPSSRLQDLTVRGRADGDYGVLVHNGGALALAGVIVERLGLLVLGRLDGEDVLVRGVGGVAASAARRALLGEAGGTATLSRVIIEHDGDEAIVLTGGARLDATDLVISSPMPSAVNVYDGGSASISGALFLGTAVRAFQRGTITIADSAFVAGLEQTTERAIVADNGGVITAQHVAIERPLTEAILVFPGSSVTFEDGWIDDTGTEDMFAEAFVGAGASLTMSRTVVAHYGPVAILANGRGARLELTDVVLRDQRPVASRVLRGVSVEVDASMRLTRVAVLRGRGEGVTVQRTGTATITDLLVDGLVEDDDRGAAFGLILTEASSLQLDRARITGVKGCAMSVQSDSRATVRELDLVDNEDIGLIVASRAQMTARNVRVSGVPRGQHDVGLGLVVDVGTLDLTDATITGAEETALFVKSRGDPATHLTNVTLSRSRVAVLSFLTAQERASLVFERVRLIENVVDIGP